MMTRLWLRRTAFVLPVILLAANLYVFFTREWESSFSPTSYATLYYPSDTPTIREWRLLGRNHLQLDIACTNEISGWSIFTNGKERQSGFGMSPSFRIDTTFSVLHEYSLVPVPEDACPPVNISVRFYSKEFYASLGMEHHDVYIVRSNVPCGEFGQYSVADWIDDYRYVGENGLAEADSILRNVVGIRDDDPTFLRMEKLFPYLRKKLKGTGGVPKDDARWMNPWVLYNDMACGTGKGWCTQQAQIWTFWANRAGIPTRFVFGARTQDNTIVYTGHSWGESYIREQQRWAFVDLSQGHLYVTGRAGRVLNTVELFQLNQHNAFDSVSARLYADWQWEGKPLIPGSDSVVTVPYAACNELVRDEFTSHSIFKFRRPPNVEDVRSVYAGFFRDRTFLTGNLERYLFRPPLAYSLYPTEGARTYLIRRVLFFAFLGSVAWWVFLLFIKRKPR